MLTCFKNTRRPPPWPAGTMRRQRGERGAGVRAGTRVWHPKDGEGQGKSALPPSAAGPPGWEPPGRPPATAGRQRQRPRGGLRGTPPPTPLPPPLPPQKRAAGGRAGRRRPRTTPERAAAPRGGRHSPGDRSSAPSALTRPPTHSLSARSRPAALRRRSRAPRGRQRDGDTQACRMEGGAQTKRPALVPVRRRRGNRPRQRDCPAPRPAGMAHWHPPPPPPPG